MGDVEIYDLGYKNAISDVKRIVESKISVLPHSDSIPSDCDDVLIDIISEIEKLEAKP